MASRRGERRLRSLLFIRKPVVMSSSRVSRGGAGKTRRVEQPRQVWTTTRPCGPEAVRRFVVTHQSRTEARTLSADLARQTGLQQRRATLADRPLDRWIPAARQLEYLEVEYRRTSAQRLSSRHLASSRSSTSRPELLRSPSQTSSFASLMSVKVMQRGEKVRWAKSRSKRRVQRSP